MDYGVFMQGLVQAMQTQAYTQAALQAQLEAQERADVWWASLLHTRFEDGAIEVAWDEFVGEMKQYLEVKKASQKRPAATFQWQDKKKAVYQAPDLQQLESSLDIGGGFPDHRLEATTPQNPEESSFGGFLGLPKESFNDTFDPFGDLLRDK
ncbi:hypothetical protein Taro_000359 [Colocasia esculenta]|uniref:Uncharacterized protein n=1 Tax=Colocasia esculenta TaxID=4460 RepID=A0A843TG99_COLES|nr:hypothetical protein [Colocasia esculenta]